MKKEWKFIVFLVFTLLVLPMLISAAELRVTQEHPFFVDDEWREAKDLVVGDVLKTFDGRLVRITNIEDVFLEEPIDVFNLEAGVFHNFVVEEGLVVHNSEAPGVRNQEIDLTIKGVRPEAFVNEKGVVEGYAKPETIRIAENLLSKASQNEIITTDITLLDGTRVKGAKGVIWRNPETGEMHVWFFEGKGGPFTSHHPDVAIAMGKKFDCRITEGIPKVKAKNAGRWFNEKDFGTPEGKLETRLVSDEAWVEILTKTRKVSIIDPVSGNRVIMDRPYLADVWGVEMLKGPDGTITWRIDSGLTNLKTIRPSTKCQVEPHLKMTPEALDQVIGEVGKRLPPESRYVESKGHKAYEDYFAEDLIVEGDLLTDPASALAP